MMDAINKYCSNFRGNSKNIVTSESSSSMWPDFLVGQPENPVRVLLVDDDVHVRTVIAQEIMSDSRTMLVAQAGSVRDGRRIIVQNDFDVMLVDLNLGDGEGLELIELMKRTRFKAEAIIFSIIETDEKVLKAFELGASGYLVKNSWFGSYPQAVLQVANGGASITPILARRLLQRFDKSSQTTSKSVKDDMEEILSKREREILHFVSSGFTSTEIGDRLKISSVTVNTHIKNIYRKLQVRTRAQAVRFAALRGWF